jgi:hypothetical protein
VSPRYPVANIAPPDPGPGIVPADVRYGEARARKRVQCEPENRYVPGCGHSFFRDLLRVSQREARIAKAVEDPILRGRDQGPASRPEPEEDEPIEHVQNRLFTTIRREQRDLSSSNAADVLRPSAPGYLGEIFGQASRQTGTLADVFGPQPLEAGMVDTVSGVPTVKIPRLATGAATAVQATQNSAIQETDPTTAAMSSPVATIAGQVDYSQQLLDFSQPGMDEVIADDLGRDFGTKMDVQIVNGSASGGNTRGLLNWSGILSITGAVTSVQAFVADVWQAFQELSGSSGFGNPDPDAYVTILHPRRLAWIYSGAGATSVPGAPILPGRVVASAGIPTNLGVGTNEDIALVVERSNVVLLAQGPTFRVDEDTGSNTLTVRTYAWAMGALLVKNAAAVAKVTGLTPPTYG